MLQGHDGGRANLSRAHADLLLRGPTGVAACVSVSLGAVRPLAALALTYDQDLTYTLSLSNATDGPFVQVARNWCQICTMNQYVGLTHEGPASPGEDWRSSRSVVAQKVKTSSERQENDGAEDD